MAADGPEGANTPAMGDAATGSGTGEPLGATGEPAAGSFGDMGAGLPDAGGSPDNEEPGLALGCELAAGLEDSLFPLEVGRVWQLELQCGTCGFERETRIVTGTRNVHGREAYVLETDVGSGPRETFWTRHGATIERWEDSLQVWETVLAEPVEEGHQWDGAYDRYRWAAVAEVETLAGTFTNCWRADIVCADPDGRCLNTPTTYCAGIGPARQSSFETFYNLEACARVE